MKKICFLIASCMLFSLGFTVFATSEKDPDVETEGGTGADYTISGTEALGGLDVVWYNTSQEAQGARITAVIKDTQEVLGTLDFVNETTYNYVKTFYENSGTGLVLGTSDWRIQTLSGQTIGGQGTFSYYLRTGLQDSEYFSYGYDLWKNNTIICESNELPQMITSGSVLTDLHKSYFGDGNSDPAYTELLDLIFEKIFGCRLSEFEEVTSLDLSDLEIIVEPIAYVEWTVAATSNMSSSRNGILNGEENLSAVNSVFQDYIGETILVYGTCVELGLLGDMNSQFYSPTLIRYNMPVSDYLSDGSTSYALQMTGLPDVLGQGSYDGSGRYTTSQMSELGIFFLWFPEEEPEVEEDIEPEPSPEPEPEEEEVKLEGGVASSDTKDLVGTFTIESYLLNKSFSWAVGEELDGVVFDTDFGDTTYQGYVDSTKIDGNGITAYNYSASDEGIYTIYSGTSYYKVDDGTSILRTSYTRTTQKVINNPSYHPSHDADDCYTTYTYINCVYYGVGTYPICGASGTSEHTCGEVEYTALTCPYGGLNDIEYIYETAAEDKTNYAPSYSSAVDAKNAGYSYANGTITKYSTAIVSHNSVSYILSSAPTGSYASATLESKYYATTYTHNVVYESFLDDGWNKVSNSSILGNFRLSQNFLLADSNTLNVVSASTTKIKEYRILTASSSSSLNATFMSDSLTRLDEITSLSTTSNPGGTAGGKTYSEDVDDVYENIEYASWMSSRAGLTGYWLLIPTYMNRQNSDYIDFVKSAYGVDLTETYINTSGSYYTIGGSYQWIKTMPTTGYGYMSYYKCTSAVTSATSMEISGILSGAGTISGSLVTRLLATIKIEPTIDATDYLSEDQMDSSGKTESSSGFIYKTPSTAYNFYPTYKMYYTTSLSTTNTEDDGTTYGSYSSFESDAAYNDYSVAYMLATGMRTYQAYNVISLSFGEPEVTITAPWSRDGDDGEQETLKAGMVYKVESTGFTINITGATHYINANYFDGSIAYDGSSSDFSSYYNTYKDNATNEGNLNQVIVSMVSSITADSGFYTNLPGASMSSSSYLSGIVGTNLTSSSYLSYADETSKTKLTSNTPTTVDITTNYSYYIVDNDGTLEGTPGVDHPSSITLSGRTYTYAGTTYGTTIGATTGATATMEEILLSSTEMGSENWYEESFEGIYLLVVTYTISIGGMESDYVQINSTIADSTSTESFLITNSSTMPNNLGNVNTADLESNEVFFSVYSYMDFTDGLMFGDLEIKDGYYASSKYDSFLISGNVYDLQ